MKNTKYYFSLPKVAAFTTKQYEQNTFYRHNGDFLINIQPNGTANNNKKGFIP